MTEEFDDRAKRASVIGEASSTRLAVLVKSVEGPVIRLDCYGMTR